MKKTTKSKKTSLKKAGVKKIKTAQKKRFAIFVSGNGTNMEAIVKAVKAGKIKGVEVAFVLSDRGEAFALKRAARLKVTAFQVSRKAFADKNSFESQILSLLKEHQVDFIVLAGYMRIVGEVLLAAYPDRILNIHPSLLPAFAGKDGIGDAFRYGVKVTGVTVHVVDAGVDSGPIVLQKATEIQKNETLEQLTKRIHDIEHELYPKAIQLMADGKIRGHDT